MLSLSKPSSVRAIESSQVSEPAIGAVHRRIGPTKQTLCTTFTARHSSPRPTDREVLTEIGEKSRFFELNRLKGPTGPLPLALVMLYDFLIGKGVSGAPYTKLSNSASLMTVPQAAASSRRP